MKILSILNFRVALGAADCAYDFGGKYQLRLTVFITFSIFTAAHAWDYAASEFIVREAGGITMDPSGGDFDLMSRRLIVSNNAELAKQLSQELVQYYPSPRDDA